MGAGLQVGPGKGEGHLLPHPQQEDRPGQMGMGPVWGLVDRVRTRQVDTVSQQGDKPVQWRSNHAQAHYYQLSLWSQSSQLSLILSESHSFHCNLTLSLLDPSISLIFAQSHSNLTHFQQQSMSVVNYTSPSSKIYFSSSCGPTIYQKSSILIFKV